MTGRDRLDQAGRDLTAERFASDLSATGITQSQARRLLHLVRQHGHAVRLLGAAVDARTAADSYATRAAMQRARQHEHETWQIVRAYIFGYLVAEHERTH